MFKRILKWLGAITAVFVIAIAIFLINLVWFRPWSLNLFYEKVFAEILFDHPEILSTLGLVEQFGITSHNGKLDDESPAHQQREFDRWKRDLAQLHQYPLFGNRRRRSFPHGCWIGFCKYKPKAKNGNGMIIPLTSSLAYRTNFRRSWRIRIGCSTKRIAITT